MNHLKTVSAGGVLLVLAAWDSSDELADVNGDGLVDTDDILAVLAAWGFCP